MFGGALLSTPSPTKFMSISLMIVLMVFTLVFYWFRFFFFALLIALCSTEKLQHTHAANGTNSLNFKNAFFLTSQLNVTRRISFHFLVCRSVSCRAERVCVCVWTFCIPNRIWQQKSENQEKIESIAFQEAVSIHSPLNRPTHIHKHPKPTIIFNYNLQDNHLSPVIDCCCCSRREE